MTFILEVNKTMYLNSLKVFHLRGGGRVIFFRKSDFDLTPNHQPVMVSSIFESGLRPLNHICPNLGHDL